MSLHQNIWDNIQRHMDSFDCNCKFINLIIKVSKSQKWNVEIKLISSWSGTFICVVHKQFTISTRYEVSLMDEELTQLYQYFMDDLMYTF